MRQIRINILLITVILICIGVVMIYSASSVYAQEKYGDGMFFLNRGIRMSEVSDGLHQTLMAGERSSKLSYSTWVGAVPHSQHGPARIVGVALFPPNSEASEEHYTHNFSSLHPAGTHFVRGDGSVQMVLETIDQDVYWKLATRAKSDIISGWE